MAVQAHRQSYRQLGLRLYDQAAAESPKDPSHEETMPELG